MLLLGFWKSWRGKRIGSLGLEGMDYNQPITQNVQPYMKLILTYRHRFVFQGDINGDITGDITGVISSGGLVGFAGIS